MRSLFVLLAILFLLTAISGAERLEPTQADASQGAPDPQFGRQRNQQSPDELKAEHDRVKALNKDRQKKLKEDTDKLLQLATELKNYVDKTSENVMSVEVIKKSDEIEKLAKSVREKMKTAYAEPGTGPQP